MKSNFVDKIHFADIQKRVPGKDFGYMNGFVLLFNN